MTETPGGGSAFLARVRAALGRPGADEDRTAPEPDASTRRDLEGGGVAERAAAVRRVMRERAGELLDQFQDSAAAAGWRVRRVASPEDVAEAVADICRATGVTTALRSEEDVFGSAPVDAALTAAGVDLSVMAVPAGVGEDGRAAERARLRAAVFEADAGITGVDYAIAETGTVVLHPRRGLSRLISLAPPRHIAILRRGDVLPSLDELFTLEREAFLAGELEGSMNLISGPSKTGDIGATIVDGIHGPLEVYLVAVG